MNFGLYLQTSQACQICKLVLMFENKLVVCHVAAMQNRHTQTHQRRTLEIELASSNEHRQKCFKIC